MSVDSMLNQTVYPDDFVIVCDGELTPELDSVIEFYTTEYPELFNIIRLPVNNGLGNALRTGLEACKNEFVARMDTDDISLPERIEKQLVVFDTHPEYSVVGGHIAEFVDEPDNIIDYRIVPTTHDLIYKMAKKRNPMNHMTVLFKKSDVIKNGNYCDFSFFEYYHLWVRMLCNGNLFHNINEICVYARVDTMFGRRHGLEYYKQSKKMMQFMKSLKLITYPQYIKNIFVRFIATMIVKKDMLNRLMPIFTRKKHFEISETSL